MKLTLTQAKLQSLKSRYSKTAAVVVALSLPLVGAMAQTGADTYSLATTPYSGVVTQTGTFINSMIANYGVPAILISVAVGGWMFVKRIAKSAFH